MAPPSVRFSVLKVRSDGAFRVLRQPPRSVPRHDVAREGAVPHMTSFADLGVSETCVRALTEAGITAPFEPVTGSFSVATNLSPTRLLVHTREPTDSVIAVDNSRFIYGTAGTAPTWLAVLGKGAGEAGGVVRLASAKLSAKKFLPLRGIPAGAGEFVGAGFGVEAEEKARVGRCDRAQGKGRGIFGERLHGSADGGGTGSGSFSFGSVPTGTLTVRLGTAAAIEELVDMEDAHVPIVVAGPEALLKRS